MNPVENHVSLGTPSTIGSKKDSSEMGERKERGGVQRFLKPG